MRLILTGLVAGILILTLCLCGCTTQPAQPPATTPPVTAVPATPIQTPLPTVVSTDTLTGVTWYLISFNQGTGSLSVLPNTEITAFFDNQGTVYGSAGCNQYTAQYQSTLNSISMKAPASTKMSCDTPTGIMTQESAYLVTIQGASTYSIANGMLTIYDSSGKAILTYAKTPPGVLTPAPLTGTTWYLTSLVDSGGTIWTPGLGSTVTAMFSNDGKLSGNSGCNQYTTSYTISGNTLAINPLFTRTTMACGASIMALEDVYLGVLPQMTVYSIDGNQLVLSDGAGKITMLYDTNPL